MNIIKKTGMAVFVLLMMGVMPAMAQNRTTTTARRTTTTTSKPAQTAVVTQPQLVDLGLPSGNLWADRNIGATSINNIGGFYAFGEVETKSTYTEQNYKGPEASVNIAGTEYDVATKKYGEGWQVPSEADFQELLDYCRAEFVMQGNNVLFKLTGENGKSIVLPFPSDYVFMRFKDYATSKQLCDNLDFVSNLKQAVADMKKQYPSYKTGLGFLMMSTCDHKLVSVKGVYVKDTKTGEESRQRYNKVENLDREGNSYYGFLVRAVFHPVKVNQPVAEPDIAVGDITLDEDASDEDAISSNGSSTNMRQIYEVAEQMPTFPGGDAALMDFLRNNVQYPQNAVENCVSGRVIVGFVVERDGSLTDVKVISRVDPSLDKEAIRVVLNMPKWNPGKQDGQRVRVRHQIPITFRLQ